MMMDAADENSDREDDAETDAADEDDDKVDDTETDAADEADDDDDEEDNQEETHKNNDDVFGLAWGLSIAIHRSRRARAPPDSRRCRDVVPQASPRGPAADPAPELRSRRPFGSCPRPRRAESGAERVEGAGPGRRVRGAKDGVADSHAELSRTVVELL